MPVREVPSWTLADVDGDRKTDIVIADAHENRIVILGNAQQSGLAAWPAEYATGVRPAAVTVADWTGDGVEDVLSQTPVPRASDCSKGRSPEDLSVSEP